MLNYQAPYEAGLRDKDVIVRFSSIPFDGAFFVASVYSIMLCTVLGLFPYLGKDLYVLYRLAVPDSEVSVISEF